MIYCKKRVSFFSVFLEVWFPMLQKKYSTHRLNNYHILDRQRKFYNGIVLLQFLRQGLSYHHIYLHLQFLNI